MTVASNALTTLANLKTELGISTSGEDTYLERIINLCSDVIEGYCGRSFYQVTSQADTLPGMGTNFLLVTRPPIASITSIVYDGDTVDSDNYEIYDAAAGLIYSPYGWNWTTNSLDTPTGDPLPGAERKLYVVTYSGGYVTPNQAGTRSLPYDLEDACIQLCVARYRRKGTDPRVMAESLGSWSASYGQMQNSGFLTEPVKEILNQYVRVACG